MVKFRERISWRKRYQQPLFCFLGRLRGRSVISSLVTVPDTFSPDTFSPAPRPHQAADTSAPGQPARPRTLGTIRLRGGRGESLGPRGHAAGVMAGRCGSARHAGGLRRLGGPARADGRQASGPKTVGVRGATPAVVARIEQEPRSL